ncbi:hypothetical protein FJZ18_00430 [Candidatus Pacearchaeota archaeon]|nr:hypothetical protein [Candidatus Pacearchaeota archaeon]
MSGSIQQNSDLASSSDLERRLRAVVDRLGFLPRPFDTDFLKQVPYWKKLLDSSKDYPGGFKALINKVAPAGYFSFERHPLPSLEQKLVGATVAQRGKVIELSKPGTRKTISALSAIVPINRMLPEISAGQESIKTFITCPGYIVPIWLREIERLFVNPEIAIITRENREQAIRHASLPGTSFVIVGYDMTFRGATLGNGSEPQDEMGEMVRVFCEYPTPSKAYEFLRPLIGSTRVEKLKKRNTPLPELHEIILREESKSESLAVFDALKQKVFPENMPYYAIVDEFHNLVGTDAKRSRAIASIARPARWAILMSGTGIGNTPEGLAWAAYVTEFVKDPDDFKKFIEGKDTAKKVRAFIDLKSVFPIRTLEEVDPSVKKPISETRTYDITDAETELFSALLEAEVFDGREKYLLLRYLIANPSKLLPDNLGHLCDGDDPLQERMQSFFNSNPGLEDKVRRVKKSRMEFTRGLVKEIKEKGEKCLVVCEYQRDVTTELESMLSDLGARRIDQTVSAEVKEVKIKEWQKCILVEDGFMRGDETYLSDLSPQARQHLKILPYEIYGMSEREKVLHEFATDPDVSVLVTTRALREGMEAKEATYIINFEETTVPCKHEQLISRTVRSGQRRQVHILNVRSPILQTVESYLERKRIRKEKLIEEIHQNPGEVSDSEMLSWIEGDDQKSVIDTLKNLRVRDVLAAHFNSMEGAGGMTYSAALSHANNAFFISSIYNRKWDETYAGNIARLTKDILLGIEKRYCTSLERILDAGAGPLAVAQTIKRPTTAIDLNPFQLHHGIDACSESKIPESTCYLGDICNLNKLVPLNSSPQSVFNSEGHYQNEVRIDNASQDVMVASLVLDLLDREGRDSFLREANRVLGNGKYLVTVLTSKKIDDSCRDAFSKDMGHYGFSVIPYFTGTYQGRISKGDDERGENVEAYVIVAQRHQVNLPNEPLGLRLKPETKVIEHRIQEEVSEPKVRKSVPLHAEYFVKLESGLNLANVDVEREDYDGRIDRILNKSDPKDVSAALSQIKAALGGYDGK